jgi:uncharacterized OB-fold protein
MAEERKLPAPTPLPETQAFWDAAAAGDFLLPKCTSCGRHHWYPRPKCPFCFGDCDWTKSAGTGQVYSYSVMRAAKPAFVIAYVALDEGPKVLTNITGTAPEDVTIGMRVKVQFKPTEGGPPVPVFVPA